MIQLVQKYGKVYKSDAWLVTNFINCWLDLDWSEATPRQIAKVVREAETMMANPEYAEMVEIARKA